MLEKNVVDESSGFEGKTEELDQNPANFAALSPLSFIKRTAAVYPNHLAVIHQQTRRTWAETYQRTQQLASALTQRGIGKGDTVAFISPNLPELFEAHFGVPMTGLDRVLPRSSERFFDLLKQGTPYETHIR